MTIQIRPELEALVRQDVEQGPYQSVEQFVEQAVAMLHAQEEWLRSHREEISEMVEDGWLAAQRGELLQSDQIKANMRGMKAEWKTLHNH